MPNFVFTAKDKSSSSGRTIKGRIEAASERQASTILRKKNLVPIDISLTREGIFNEISSKLIKKVSLGEVSNFTRNLSTMITAGLPLTDALIILKNQSSSKLTPVVEEILKDVEGGGNLGDALARHSEVFTKVYVALVRAGESAGILDQVMARLADNLEKEKEFKAKVKGAMIYPVIIVVGMALVALIMMIFVIPKMLSLYTEFGTKLPAPTRALIALSGFLTQNLPFLIFLGVAGFYGYLLFQKTPMGKRKIDELKLTIPLFGELQKQVELTEISRALGLLIGAGIQIVEALNIVAAASSNSIFEEGIRVAAKQVEKGSPLSTALGQNESFPPIMGQLLSVGEETGKVDEVLLKISHFFESESDQLLKGLTTAIEPLIMIVLGVGVGFLIIAIIMPIYNLTSQF